MNNFWGVLYESFPNSVKDDFCKWVDDYKRFNNWDTLFNGNTSIACYSDRAEEWAPSGITKAPKFHDLTLAMQLGIIMQFLQERNAMQFIPGLAVRNSKKSFTESFVDNIVLYFEYADKAKPTG